jgi:hypothetical protein
MGKTKHKWENIKMDQEVWRERVLTGSTGSVQGPMVDSSEHNNELQLP